MRKLLLPFLILIATSVSSQTTWQVCVTEADATGGFSCTNTAVFTPATLNIAVGDNIQFTTFMVALTGYNGIHDIQFTGSAANNVMLPISTDILNQVTTVTTPPFNTPGNFDMECVNSNHCFIADLMSAWSCTGYSVTVGTVTEIAEEKLKHEVSVYPNPTSNIININLLPILVDNPKIYIIDILGKVVRTISNVSSNLILDATSYKKGIYFIKITTDKGTIVEKIIIE